ncbi:MAG: sigma-54-dependent Fis family transcriptional regulator [Gemmatimonadetes bacterium]|nr:sigma-54-dependent Fis family transcriptional regulator [Gemmatimonadota bacterium]
MKNEEALIVVVDDEDLIRTWLGEKLRSAGYTVETASTGAEGRRLVVSASPALMLLDLRLPDGDGIRLLEEFRDIDRDLIVIIVTAYGEIDTAVEAVKSGAYDFIEKPVEFDALLLTIEKALETRRLRRQVAVLREQHRWRFAQIELVGRSGAMQSIVKMVEKVAAAESATVLLTGESGTGKDLVARAIHAHSVRADQPFVEINCSAMPDNLVESELFGHERGAYTGARSRKQGLAELADGGTLFLDEVGDMPAATQAKVLRFLEDSKFKRVGGTTDIRVDARVIAATNHDLDRMVETGAFRSDLFFRLKVVPIHIPPLRARRDDIAPLALFFIEQLSLDLKREPATLSESALHLLESYDWPGNARELRNVLERVLILGELGEIRAGDIPVEMRVPLPASTLGVHLCELPPEGLRMEDVETDLIRQALVRTSGNVTRAANLLGLSRDTLRYRLEKYASLADTAVPEAGSR